MSGETPTLARFVVGHTKVGTSADGLPVYEETIKIIKERPPYLQVTEIATEADKEEFAHPWQMFQRELAGRKLDGKTGYPLVMWPAAGPAEIKMCADREIYTVEQLAKLANARDDKAPPQIVELAKRAKRMVELSKETGRYEAKISELEAQLKAQTEQVNELRAANEGLTQKLQIFMSRPAA